jgi:hypothetical protein
MLNVQPLYLCSARLAAVVAIWGGEGSGAVLGPAAAARLCVSSCQCLLLEPVLHHFDGVR